jgi:hypothetical protein
MVAGMVLLLAAAFVHFVRLDRPGLVGAGIGAGLGLLNLGAGYLVTSRALRRGMNSAMLTLLGGFFARLVLLVVGTLWFQSVAWADAVAFALAFMVFFFVYVGLEIALVERALRGKGKPA